MSSVENNYKKKSFPTQIIGSSNQLHIGVFIEEEKVSQKISAFLKSEN